MVPAMIIRRRRSILFLSLVSTVMILSGPASGGPINSNVAFTPREGGSIFRLQYMYSESDGRGAVQHVNASSVMGTYVYGLKKNLGLFLTVPYANRQVDRIMPGSGRMEEAHDGIGDVTFLAKYRFWQNDTRPRETFRLAALVGLNVRSGDSDFSSDSYDPIVGAVFTWRRDRNLFDADLIYQINTGSGVFRHDALRYDLAYSYQLAPAVYDPNYNYEWNAVAEINGRYTADGSHEVFLSPGIQYITEQWAIEASLQLPVVQEFSHGGPETDYRLIIGLRWQW